MPLTPQDFVSKWKRVNAREKQTYQEHFLDLNDGETLQNLLALNLERAK